jgi:predicted RND superfamily exporter protein
VALLLLIWVVLFVVATRWWTPHPKRTLLLPLIAIVIWFGVLVAGEALLDWTA